MLKGSYPRLEHLDQLSGQITTLTEEIEELRDKKSMLLASLDCRNDADAKEITKHLQTIEQNLVKLAEQREKLTAMREDDIVEFEATRAEIHPEDITTVLDSRIDIRREHTAKLAARLREVFGKDYDYRALTNAEDKVDTSIKEKPGEITVQAMNREYERQHPQRQEKTHKRRTHDFEMTM